MGYTITIGEARMETPDANEAMEWPHLRVGADGFANDDAPTFPGDAMTGNGSSRSPSYTAWGDFCEEVGLYALFFGAENRASRERGANAGLMSQHPGAALLTKRHHEVIAAALDRYRAAHPDARPGWREVVAGGHYFNGPWKPETENLDGNLARLVWMEWWTRWVLANCKIPTLANR